MKISVLGILIAMCLFVDGQPGPPESRISTNEQTASFRLLELAPRGIGPWDDSDLVAKFEALRPEGIDPWDLDWLLSEERELAIQIASWAFYRARDTRRVPIEEMKRFGLKPLPDNPDAFHIETSEHPEWVSLADMVSSNHFRAREDYWLWLDELIARGFGEQNARKLKAFVLERDPVAEGIEARLAIIRINENASVSLLAGVPDPEKEMRLYMDLTIEMNRACDQIWYQWAADLFGLFERRYQRILVATWREVGLTSRTTLRTAHERDFWRLAPMIADGSYEKNLMRRREQLRGEH